MEALHLQVFKTNLEKAHFIIDLGGILCLEEEVGL